ncbi:UDP-N-acetylmuramate--L-alanine ligase [Fibrobacterales bacterium]|nr:UDP-N-acetylmuramate--L-alanine ligase [Fibrobacterales bacterium]
MKESYFFVGVAGVGMSALAQFLAGRGVEVAGSDRRFSAEDSTQVKRQLEAKGVKCFLQDGSGIHAELTAVVVSTAIEQGNPDLEKAKKLSVPVMHRSELLAKITLENPTIAVSGTSGKSTVTGLIWHILNFAGKNSGLLSGAGLVELEEKGEIGNAAAGKNNGYLVAEADESDGSLVRYSPKIGVILNIDKDHKELSELRDIFNVFADNVKKCGGVLIVNEKLNFDNSVKFGWGNAVLLGDPANGSESTIQGENFSVKGFGVEFSVKGVNFYLPALGKHNAENALAAIAVCLQVGISLEICASALKTWKGIHRRSQIYPLKNGVILVDDYAHNPAKIAASIRSCQQICKAGVAGGKLFAWFQPHGFGPTKFLKDDLIEEISNALRTGDSIWFSSIYYAGGTADRSFNSDILADGIAKNNCEAHFIPDRDECLKEILSLAKSGDVILLMGARDPSLAEFAKKIVGCENLY